MASLFGPGGLFGLKPVQKNPAETEAEANEIWAGLTNNQRQEIYNLAKQNTRLPQKFKNNLENYEKQWNSKRTELGFADWVLSKDLSDMIQSFYIVPTAIPVHYKVDASEKALIYSIFREILVTNYADRIRLLKNLNEVTNRDGSEGHAKLILKDIKGISDELLEARVDLLRAEKSKAGVAWGSVAQPGKTRRRKNRK